MLGRQLGVYLDENDVNHVVDRVRSTWDCVLLKATSETAAPDELRAGSPVPLKSFFCLENHVEMLIIKPVTRARWTLDTRDNPLIEWWVPPEQAAVLRPGRLFYEPAAVVEGALVEKDDEFLDFARGLVALARDLAPRREVNWGKARVGQSAARRLIGGELSLKMNG